MSRRRSREYFAEDAELEEVERQRAEHLAKQPRLYRLWWDVVEVSRKIPYEQQALFLEMEKRMQELERLLALGVEINEDSDREFRERHNVPRVWEPEERC